MVDAKLLKYARYTVACNKDTMKEIYIAILVFILITNVAPETRKDSYVEIAFILDHDMYQVFEYDTDQLHLFLRSVLSDLTKLFRPLNIYFKCVGVDISKQPYKTQAIDIDQHLSHLADLSKNTYSSRFNQDILVLISANNFNRTHLIGKTNWDSVCKSYSVAIARFIAWRKNNFVMTLAHEIAHTLGFEHDQRNCLCKSTTNKCIMYPYLHMPNRLLWSNCSQLAASNVPSKSCLRKFNDSNFSFYPMCGNALTEFGETCDCKYQDNVCIQLCNQKLCKHLSVKENETIITKNFPLVNSTLKVNDSQIINTASIRILELYKLLSDKRTLDVLLEYANMTLSTTTLVALLVMYAKLSCKKELNVNTQPAVEV